MPRRVWGDGIEITYQDLSKIGTAVEKEFYDRIISELLQRQENAFFADSFEVTYVGATTINVNSGNGFQTDETVDSPEPTRRLLFLDVDTQKTLSNPHASLDRIDIISVKADRDTSEEDDRNYKDPDTEEVTSESVETETDWSADIVVTTGTPGVTPSAPSTPSGYIKIAECYMHAATGLGGPEDITDERTLMPIGGSIAVDTTGFESLTEDTAQAIQDVLSEIDVLLRRGNFEYTKFDDLGAAPSTPATGSIVAYFHDGVFKAKNSDGVVQTIGREVTVRTMTGAGSILATDHLIEFNAATGAFAAALPSAASCTGKVFHLIKVDSTEAAVTLTGTINGVTNPTLNSQYQVMTIYSNGTAFRQLA